MRYRAYVLSTMLSSFVQRRDDAVLRNSLPTKNEYTIKLRLTKWQEWLYRQVWGATSCFGTCADVIVL